MEGHDRKARIVELVGRYESALIRYAQQITGDLDRARDVVQETFLRVCRRFINEEDDHVVEWLFTVCRNCAIDRLRKEKRVYPMRDDVIQNTVVRTPQPSESAVRQEERDHMLKELEQLPAPQQEVLCLKFKEDMSYKEISRITGNSVTNVGFLIHTGLKRLRQRLTGPNPNDVAQGG